MNAIKKSIFAAIMLTLCILFISHKKAPHLPTTIIESDKLSSVLNYVNSPNTLVIFDIDNTLAHPTEELSSDEWFCHLVNTKMAQGYDEITSVYYALPAAYYAQFNVPLQATESHIPDLIKQLTDQGIAVMALSTRSLFIAERTLEQLDAINIHFSLSSVDTNDLVLPMKYPCYYKNGILFTGNNDKGKALQSFLNSMNYYPSAIIFVDDKMKYLLSVEKTANKLNVPFYGIRYSGCDERVRTFDMTKAEKQWFELKEKNRTLAKA